MLRLEHFLVCEDARVEATGHLTMVGFYAGAMRVLDLTNVLRVTCVVVVNGMHGVDRFNFRFEVRADDQVLIATPTFEVNRQPGEDAHTIIQPFIPFPVPREGDYHLRLSMQAGSEARTFGRKLRVEQIAAPPRN